MLGVYEIKFIGRLVTGMALHHNIFKSEKESGFMLFFKHAYNL